MNKEDYIKKIKEWRENPVTFVKEVLGVEPDPWQIDFLQAFPGNERLALKACKGPGKSQPVSMQLYTPNGQRVWGDLKPDDLVFAEDGTPTRIIATHPQGIRCICKITFDDGTFTECDISHLWKVRGRTEKRHKTWKVVDTSELIETYKVKQGGEYYYQYQIPLQGAAEFPEKELPVAPYVVGAWLGDGTRGKDEITTSSNALVGNLKKYCDLKTYHNKEGNFWQRKLNLWNSFKELECFKCLSYEKFIPESYKLGSIEQRKNLLAGLMDTDGTIDKRDGTMEYNTTSKQLAEDVAWLVRSLGGKVQSIKEKIGKLNGIEHRVCYRVRVTTSFNPFQVFEKGQYWKNPTQDRYLYRTIKNIEYVRDEEAMCIEVEHPSHCYLANDFIVTHNTAVLAMACWNFLATRPHPKMAATSITSDNLADGLWTEMAKWMSRSQFLQENFEWQKTRIVYKYAPETWFMSARSWPKTGDSSSQADTLAGLHADYLLFVLDEVGGIPDSVMAAAEAGLSTGVETKIIMAGNPTHLSGPLYRACNQERHLWHVQEISGDPDDPKRATRIKLDWAISQREKWGVNSNFYRVNVLGQFPLSQENCLLSYQEVADAMNRIVPPHAYTWSQKRLGVDVARFGADSTVLFPRQGLTAFMPVQLREADTREIASRVMMAKQNWNHEIEFIDDTGGFGAGVIDNLNGAGYSPVGINFSSKATDNRYFNIRAEMYFNMANWVKKGGCLPRIDELIPELTAPTYSFQNGKLKLESKEDIKEKIGRSPDLADSLCLTFAWPDQPARTLENIVLEKYGNNKAKYEYDPLEDRF